MDGVAALYGLFHEAPTHVPEYQADVIRQAAEILAIPTHILLGLDAAVTLPELYQMYGLSCRHLFTGNAVHADILRIAASIMGKDVSYIWGLIREHPAALTITSWSSGLPSTAQQLSRNVAQQIQAVGVQPALLDETLAFTSHDIDAHLEDELAGALAAPFHGSCGEIGTASLPPCDAEFGTPAVITAGPANAPENLVQYEFWSRSNHNQGLHDQTARVGLQSVNDARARNTLSYDYVTEPHGDIGDPSQPMPGFDELRWRISAEQPTSVEWLPLPPFDMQHGTLYGELTPIHKRPATNVGSSSSVKRLGSVKVSKTKPKRKNKACPACFIQKSKCIKEEGSRFCCRRCREGFEDGLKTRPVGKNFVLKDDTTLFRTGSTLPRWRNFPFTGPDAGRLRMIQIWQLEWTQEIELTQGALLPSGQLLTIRLRVTRFNVPKDLSFDEHENFTEPFALADLNEACLSIRTYVEQSFQAFAPMFVKDRISKKVFGIAVKLADGGMSQLTTYALRLWTAARTMEMHWQRVDQRVQTLVDHQLACASLKFVLEPLRKELLRMLLKTIKESKRKQWFEIFLASYIILHSMEVLMQQQHDFANKRHSNRNRWTNPELIKELLSSANYVLMFFHACSAGQDLLSVDWRAKNALGDLHDEHRTYMTEICQMITAQGPDITRVTRSDEYYRRFCLTGQLFEKSWKTRDISISTLTNAKRESCDGSQYVSNTASQLPTLHLDGHGWAARSTT